ncbi:S-layer homology domain-containing protein [Bengtsoniella intestinalis]|uniref:S-layer homology domain-containing protein n=1 Tax=Bengtsoniella intestinalis TaxID=3073143 RepID=UPI00391F349F
MKKRTRFLAWVMTLVMMFSCYGGTTVFAVDSDTDRSADVCTVANHDDWQALTTATIGQYMTLSGGHYYLNEGSYYLAETLKMGVTIYIWPGATVNLCLNGFDIAMQNSNRTILNPKNSATLNLYDCGTQVRYYDENGWVTTEDGRWETATDEEKATALAAASNPIEIVGGAIYGASSFDKGGAGVFIQNYATFNMYGGNILGCSCSVTGHWGGGVYNYEGTFNMYSGVIAYNSSSSYAGGLFIRSGSVVNMYGGEIAYNYAPTSGAGVYSGGVFTMSGDASIHDNYGSYLGSGFYNFGGGTLTMTDTSRISDNISGDGGGAGVYMPSYNSILNMSDNASITGNKSTGVAVGVDVVSGVMTISDNAQVSGNYVVESVTTKQIETTNKNGTPLTMIDTVGADILPSNVYLYNGKTITFDGFNGNAMYVTSAAGLGLVATNATDEDGNLQSDVESYYAVRQNDTQIYLTESQTLTGDTAIEEYAKGDVDLSKLGMFDVLTSDTVYTIIGGTGVGTIDGEDLDVSSIGTFTIEAYTPHSSTNPPTWQTSTLTVTAKPVYITGIATIGSEVDKKVELDNTQGNLTGVVNSDDVSIDFTVAYGMIVDEDYQEGVEDTYDVLIHDVSITGDDAGNYVLKTVNGGTVNVDSATTVDINVATPYISWPTAQDIVYGNAYSDADLIGGTVVILYDGEYYDITDKGDFVWVETGTVDDAGTHTYAVQFEFDDDIKSATEGGYIVADYDKYIAAVEALTHNVSQVVQAAEVTFTIADSTLEYGTPLSIIVKDENGDTVPMSDYDYLYYVDGAWVDTEPTAVGSYLVGASLTANYRHAGTQESTAKQIGAFEIYETSASTTYSVTFDGYTGGADYDITDALPQTIHILPTLDEDEYSAWKTSSSGSEVVYAFGSRFAQPEYSVTFTAVPAVSTVNLSGTITGTDLEGNTNTRLAGVVVTLMQGPEQIAVAVTDGNGNYEFDVPAGRYNVVVTRDQVIRNEITLYVNLNGTTVMPTISIPDIRQNTIFNVASGMTAITVDGMEDLIGSNETRSVKVELTPSSDTAAILAEAAKSALTADNAKFYIDLSIQERANDAAGYSEIDLTGFDSLTFYIPLAGLYQGYDNYTVYFDNGSSVVELTAGDFTVVGDLLTLTAQKSGVYGLAFWDTEDEIDGIDMADVEYTAEPISTDSMFTGIESTGTRTYIITGGTGEGTIDEDGNVTVTKVGTFDITVKVAATADDAACYSSGTLTVSAKPVTISAITCIDQEVDSTSYEVALNTGALLTGVEDGDSVRIDFTDAIGEINDENYATNATLAATGEETFAVTASGFALTGTDADNYTISETSDYTSQVTITMPLVYIAWPTATDIVYGETQSADDLYGGKVVVYDGTYTDITDEGSFQWVTLADDAWDSSTNTDFDGDTVTLTNTGTYTYDVKFVETVPDGTYSPALANATQMITQVVQPAAVSFAITNSIVTVANAGDLTITPTAENGHILVEGTDYYLQYSLAESGVWDTEKPTTSGNYYVAATFNTTNYRHMGTMESTGKQIGAFTIYEDAAPATYSVTYKWPDGSIYLQADGFLYQTIHNLPNLDETPAYEDLYTGWLLEGSDTTYAFDGRYVQSASDVVFTAVEAPTTITNLISGTITGTDLNGATDVGISRVGVALYQGSTLVASDETDSSGNYAFTIPAGRYNLVVTYDLDNACTITAYVDVSDGVADTQNFTLPNVVQRAILTVQSGMPALTVDGLNALVEVGTNSGTQNSEAKLTISALEDVTNNAEVNAIKTEAATAGLTDDNLKLYMNIDLTTKVGYESTHTPETELDDPLVFYIPLTGIFQGHDDYVVYRYHNGGVDTLTETELNGEYIKVSDDKSSLEIHATCYSLYAIAFANEDTVVYSSSSSAASTYNSSVASASNGDVSVSSSKATSGSKITITTDPDEGYEVGTVTVTYSSGREVSVTDNVDGTYSYLQPGASVTVTVTFVELNSDGSASGDNALPFVDVSVDDWFYEDVLYLYNLGIMSGTTATTFSPYDGNSRAMVAQLMYNLEGQPERTEFDFFPDVVVGQWHEPAINWCAAHGVVDGYTDGLYRPDRIISRQEFASILYDNCLHFDYDLSVLADLSGFADAPSDWAMTYVMWAVEEGVLQGDTNGYLNCSDQLTRCEAAVMFARFLRNVYES